MILTDKERKELKSMSIYWREVRNREDTTPLYQELQTVCDKLGTRILDIIESYIEECETEEQLNKPRFCEDKRCPRFGKPLTNGECKP